VSETLLETQGRPGYDSVLCSVHRNNSSSCPLFWGITNNMYVFVLEKNITHQYTYFVKLMYMQSLTRKSKDVFVFSGYYCIVQQF